LAFAEPAVAKFRADLLTLLTFGSMPDVVRRRFEIPWSNQDRLRFLGVALTIRTAGAALDPRRFDVLFPPDTPHAPVAAGG
jgi:hypothetical protein